MCSFEWIAIIGAAAWLPQVIGWIARHFAKPKIRVIPSRAPEIGYSSLGPIFNLTCALAADRKDGVVERITARLTHERGQCSDFLWASLTETFSQVQSAEGIAVVSKNQPAVALKVSTLVLTEKQVGMQERSFDEEPRVLMNALIDRQNLLKQTDSDRYAELTLKCKEFADLVGFAKKRFPWQEGKYTAEIALQIVGVKESTVQTFHFSLTANDVDRLRQNIEEIERYFRNLIQPPADGTVPSYHWNWAYPPFEPDSTSS